MLSKGKKGKKGKGKGKGASSKAPVEPKQQSAPKAKQADSAPEITKEERNR